MRSLFDADYCVRTQPITLHWCDHCDININLSTVKQKILMQIFAINLLYLTMYFHHNNNLVHVKCNINTNHESTINQAVWRSTQNLACQTIHLTKKEKQNRKTTQAHTCALRTQVTHARTHTR